jgi:hypothetical protein
MRFRTVMFCAAVLTATSAHADTFSWQLAGSARESDIGPSAEAEGATLAVTYHFRPVDDAAGPYALAAFLNRSSRIGATYNEDKVTSLVPVITIGPIAPPPSSPVTVVNRAAGRSLSGQYVWSTSGWYVGAALAEADAAHPAPLPTAFSVLGDDVTSYSLALGKYVGPSTAVELSLGVSETTLTSELPVFCVGGLCGLGPIARITTTLETEAENIAISAIHVGSLGKLRYSLSGGVTSSEADLTVDVVLTQLLPLPLPPLPPTLQPVPPPVGGFSPVAGSDETSVSLDRRARYALAGELFPTQALGIRLGYARWDGDELLDESYELGVTWFFRRSIGAQVVLARTKSGLAITTVEDIDSVTLQVIGRL